MIQNTTSNSNISFLPIEIFYETFSELDIQDIAICQRVCKAWKENLDKNLFWKLVIKKHLGYYVVTTLTLDSSYKEQFKNYLKDDTKIHAICLEKILKKIKETLTPQFAYIYSVNLDDPVSKAQAKTIVSVFNSVTGILELQDFFGWSLEETKVEEEEQPQLTTDVISQKVKQRKITLTIDKVREHANSISEYCMSIHLHFNESFQTCLSNWKKTPITISELCEDEKDNLTGPFNSLVRLKDEKTKLFLSQTFKAIAAQENLTAQRKIYITTDYVTGEEKVIDQLLEVTNSILWMRALPPSLNKV